jgi:lipoate-protein ligase A
MRRWRLLETWDATPAQAMGLDEALLLSAGAPPTLRLYTWKPDTLSLGYFQKLAEVPGRDRASAIVRRITGGGAIHHVEELTFSITVERDHPLYAGPISESYRRVHAAVIDALRALGLPAVLREDSPTLSDRHGTGMCFHQSTPLDIIWNGRKGVGTAQRRSRDRILHHGSIKLGSSILEGEIATTAECGREHSAREMAEVLIEACSARFQVALESCQPEAGEVDAASSLGERFLDRDFVHRR